MVLLTAISGASCSSPRPRRTYCARTFRHSMTTLWPQYMKQHWELHGMPQDVLANVQNIAGIPLDTVTGGELTHPKSGPPGNVDPRPKEGPVASLETPGVHTTYPLRISRRVTGGLLLASGATVLGGHGALPVACGQAQARPPQPSPPPCNGPLNGQLAAALTRAVYSSVIHLQVMDEADFQRENFKLREREYKYYAEANRAQLPRVPNLADNAGGLSNPAYFNFIHYCLWKVVYRHVVEPWDRETFACAVAREFLANLPGAGLGPGLGQRAVPGGAGGLAAEAAAPDALVRGAVLPFLEFLRAGGYICSYQLVLGDHPGSWSQDWMLSEPVLVDAASGKEGGGGLGSQAGDFFFQLKLHRPADILGSVALRSEEGGAWPRTVSRCVMLLLERRGYRFAAAAGLSTGPPSSLLPRLELQCHGGPVEGPLGRCCVADCDEFFYQDRWQGPKSFTDKLLLFLGDPLEQVAVDFIPTTLVQNWRLRGGGGSGA